MAPLMQIGWWHRGSIRIGKSCTLSLCERIREEGGGGEEPFRVRSAGIRRPPCRACVQWLLIRSEGSALYFTWGTLGHLATLSAAACHAKDA